jgi:hypothetical protein
VRLMTGIDTAMPDVNKTWSYHAAWNQNDRLWEEDFRQIAGCGFDLLRWGMPWSLAEPSPGEYRWDLIDPKVELATRLGVEIFYPIVHFNLPAWIAQEGDKHSVLSVRLSDRLEQFTDRLLSRYNFRLVIPVVEVAMDAFQRGRVGAWQPHLKSREDYDAIHANLVRAFKASARVAHAHGSTVVCSEPATEIQTVLDLKDSIDIAGIDLYPHMHKRRTILGFFRQWWKAAQVPLCISEFGSPETYDPVSRKDTPGDFMAAGLDQRRIQQAQQLAKALQRAEKEGIPIPIGGWYPGTGNIGWGDALTTERTEFDCDRAGLVDLERQPDGSLKRVLCAELVKEVLGLSSSYRYRQVADSHSSLKTPKFAGIPTPEIEPVIA